jgi:hypothetical protein
MVPQYTIFVSYSQSDNLTRWVSRFALDLEQHLPSELKIRANCLIWRDDRLSQSEPFPAEIRAAAAAADIYLAIVSHQYFNSEWCRTEREVFLSARGEEAAGRLFLIHYRPVERDHDVWPAEFTEVLGFEFFERHPDGFTLPLGDDPQQPGHLYRERVRRVASQIAKKLEEIDDARRQALRHAAGRGKGALKRREGGPPPREARVLVLTPRDVARDGLLLVERVQESRGLRVDGREITLVPGTFEDLLAAGRQRGGGTPLHVVVLVVWSELGVHPDGEGAGGEHGSLVEGTYRVARERGAAVLLYRCTRELTLRPDDPDWEQKVTSLKGVSQFFAPLQDGSAGGLALHSSYQTSDELLERFEGDLQTLLAAAVERSAREVQLRLPELFPSSPAPADMDEVLRAYLGWVEEKHERLELRGIGGTLSLASIPLEDVYIALRGVRVSEHERQQSRALLQAELFSLVRALPEGVSALDFAQLVEEAEARALVDNPVMPFLTERDRVGTAADQPAEITLSLGEAFRTERWLVVLGDPGSGKTTLLRWLARTLARALIPAPHDPTLTVEVPAYKVDPSVSRDDARRVVLGPARLPVLVRVSEFADALLKARKNGQTLALIDFLGMHTWQGESPGIQPDWLNQLIRGFLRLGRGVVLLDGMDEVTASSQRDEVVHAIEAFIADWINDRGESRPGTREAGWSVHRLGVPWESGGNQIVITSRIAGYHASPIAGPITHMTVQPMQRRAVEHFCDAWTLAVYRESFPDGGAAAMEDARREAEGLKAEIFNPLSPQVWELASNPLMITILALIYRNRKGELPRQRPELYHRALEILIENWRFTDISTEEFIYVLSPLAARIHSEYATGLVREDEMREIITRELAGYRGESADAPPPRFVREVKSFIRRVGEDVGLLSERSTRLYGFLHLTFQEYLAGLYLVRDRNGAGQALVDRLDQPRWREPILLALGHVSSNPDWGPEARGKLLRQILDADDPLGDLLPRGPLLVIGALPEMENVPDELVSELLDRLLRAYTLSANDDASNALARQIEKAVNTVYNSRHRDQVVTNLARLLTLEGPADMDRIMACASLVRANGWRPPELVGPLLRCQPFDDAKWKLPVTEILRGFVASPLPPTAKLVQRENEVDALGRELQAMRDGSWERAVRGDIAALEARLGELEAG